jgi:hypothetical protein
MDRAFRISVIIFVITLSILLFSIAVPEDSRYANYFGLQEIISVIKTIDTADLYLTILSFIASLVTYIGKKLFKGLPSIQLCICFPYRLFNTDNALI